MANKQNNQISKRQESTVNYVDQKEDISSISIVDAEIIDTIELIVEKIDRSGYLSRLLAKYKLSVSDKSMLVKLRALNEELANRVFDDDDEDEGIGQKGDSQQFEVLFLDFEGQMLQINKIYRVEKKMFFDFNQSSPSYQIIINPSLKEDLPNSNITFSYKGWEVRDAKYEALKLKLRTIPYIKFI